MERAVGKAERLLQIEALLLEYTEGLSQAEVARRIGVNRSTIYRYLPDLTARFAVYETDDGRLAIDRDHYLLNVRLTLHESMALHLAARLMATRTDKQNPHAAAALRKLGLALEKLAPRVAEHLKASAEVMEDLARRHDPVYLHVLETLTRAWSDCRVAHLWHRMPDGRVFDYDFAPYFIEPYAVGQTTHVIGWRESPGALRTFKLERIQRIELTDREYTIPDDFDPREKLADAWGIWYTEVEPVEVVLKFHPRVAQRVRETRWHRSEQVEEQPDGSLIWQAWVAEPQEMVPWIRGWGADVEVVGPRELREIVTRHVRALANIYGVQPPQPDSPLERLLRCWGKTEKTTRDFHPALFHMLDAGHVAQVLLCPPASSRWRGVLATALGAEPETLGVWLPYVIAMHDIGKISAAFQSQIESQHERLKAEGFPFKGWRTSLKVHHSQVGQVYVQQWEASELTLSDNFRQMWVDMVGGHHGQFRHSSGVRKTLVRLQKYEPPLWQQLRDVAAQALQEHFLAPALYTLTQPDNISTATMALTGFTILCDWLGSDECFFQPASDFDLERYIPESQKRAQRAVEAAGFLERSHSRAPILFTALFPDKHPPRPLQEAVDAIPEEILATPCLAIIEAPTGEGKTEAALALAHRLAQASGTDEMYYALPTTATSNQMFVRLQEHLHDRLNLPTEIKLIHGQAFLMEDDLRIEPLDNAEQADQDAMVEWFTSKKRAILAPFGVGTVDQAELAALNVKHNALRLMGLAGKVVIFDEVHAYDTYMTTIVETLLQWLSALGTSVIILSATLPQAQRAALARAYGADVQASPEQAQAYPSLWLFSQTQPPYHTTPSAYQPDRRLAVRSLHLAEDASQAKAQWLLDAVAEGGCACWITNTVAQAQQVFEELTKDERSGDIDLTLLHARFPLEDRQTRERQLSDTYGPNGDHRPKRGIVVGTQVLEQSLDLDFDVMVSDLAPVDLLLQRAGRLQRHDRTRPASYADHPTLWINTELDSAGELDLGVNRWIYDAFLLRQTWQVLQCRDKISLPGDYRELVEAVYGITEVSLDSPLAEAWGKLQIKRSDAMKEAKERLIPEPDPEWSFCPRVAKLTFEEDETGASWVVAQTRLGRESVNLIPLEREGDMARLSPTGEMVALDRRASREMQLSLLRRHLRVSRPEIVRALKEAPLPKLFTKSPKLKGYYPLWLTDGKAEFPLEKGKLVVILDDELGLVIHKEKGA
ncbi:MAG: CRISPR-associated helicase Cas3' [Anaerolineae bacterium]